MKNKTYVCRIVNNQLVRFCFVGIMNTITTLLIIFGLMYLGISLYTANISGYVAGIILSFLLNSHFTFSVELRFTRFIKFIITVATAYGFNIITIQFVMHHLSFNEYSSQLSGMIIYTIACFVINKKWAMK